MPVLMRSCAVASRLVKTTSPASMIRFKNGRFDLATADVGEAVLETGVVPGVA